MNNPDAFGSPAASFLWKDKFGGVGLKIRRLWRRLILLGAGGLLAGCAVIGNGVQFEDDYYRVVRMPQNDSLRARLDGLRPYTQLRHDTLLLTPEPTNGPLLTYRCPLQLKSVRLLRRQLDVDVFTIPFKVRPARAGVPVQLNTTFNAALYVGRRLDLYSVKLKKTTPFGPTTHVRAKGLGYGGFLGAGSTIITADVVRGHPPAAEYEGLVLHGGLAAIYDAQAFNIGAAVGVDQLLGADNDAWIYQRQPWFGVLFGLNLN